ncbi:hypothetical protein BD626DRAFT_276595 [Schizophyllum amplum]|uniref:Uncharacterized protein n=1 Tax=Schizophyllum amplum TaxID=97359 RepID=A0A550BTM2_9AGAR|nr:hypothetical protein BD626DRAFT_276595 [Auriculariopsis ampla]
MSTDHISSEATQIESERHPLSAEDQSPISRLPMELLSRIFLHVISDSWLDGKTTTIICTQIARVCVTWREVTQGTAELWTDIDSKETNVKLKDQLVYSVTLPLHLTHERDQLRRNVALSRFLGRVGAHMQRVESLFFSTTCKGLAAVPVQNLPMLAQAHIIYTGKYNPNILNFLANATALTDLTLQGAECTYMRSHVEALRAPPFPSLTRMTLVLDINVHPEWFLSTIAQCGTENLTFLHLAFCSLSDSEPPRRLVFTRVDLTLPVLRTLILESENYTMLRYIDAPQLESIVFSYVYDLGDPFVSFSRFLAQTPMSSIRALELHEATGDPSAFLTCLALLPDLDRMAITWGHIRSIRVLVVYDPSQGPLTAEVLDRMTGDSERPPLVPRLTSVHFDISSVCRNFSEPALSRFVRSRRAPSVRGGCSVAALEKVVVTGIYGSDNDFRECDGERDG